MKKHSKVNKLVLNKRIIANLNRGEMFNLKSGGDFWDYNAFTFKCEGKETDPIQCPGDSDDPKRCKPVPTDFGIPTHDKKTDTI